MSCEEVTTWRMVGAYVFGYLADRFGRKRLFLLTLLLYGIFTFLTALAWDYGSFMVLRMLTAVGIGAEYAAINAAISEFIPARHRGKTNATVMNFWSLGASWVSAYPTFSEIFPTHLRSTGIGLSVAVGRIGAFIAPVTLVVVANAAGMLPALALLAGFWLIGVIAMVSWYFRGVEGRGMPLEAMVD